MDETTAAENVSEHNTNQTTAQPAIPPPAILSHPSTAQIPSSATAAKIALSTSHAAIRVASSEERQGDQAIRSRSSALPDQTETRGSQLKGTMSERSPNEMVGLTATLQQADAMRAAQESAIKAQHAVQKAHAEQAQASLEAETRAMDQNVSFDLLTVAVS
jgi:hypothetical protein